MPVALRERKKVRTREGLTSAAVALFIDHGYDATTVEDIAAAVEVSPRTFFRYFATKEDVIVDLLRSGVVDVVEQLGARPADEPLPQALRAAVQAWARLSTERSASLLQVSRVLESAPCLRARFEQERRCGLEALEMSVAARLDRPAKGSRPDRRPARQASLIVALVSAGISNAVERWSSTGGQGDLATYLDESFDLLEFGLPQGLTGG